MASALRRVLEVLLGSMLLVGLGCSHHAPRWQLTSTNHFRIYSDQDRKTVARVLSRLEEVYTGLAVTLFQGHVLPVVEVFVFSPADLQRINGSARARALLTYGAPTILALHSGKSTDASAGSVAHELAHAFMFATAPGLPNWFNEGFATYCESIQVRDDMVLLGSVNRSPLSSTLPRRLVNVSDLFATSRAQFHGSMEFDNYATAWTVVHYLWHGEGGRLRARFDAFVAALSAVTGEAGGSERAWRVVFPDLPLRDLDQRLRAHVVELLGSEKHRVAGFPFDLSPLPKAQTTAADMTYVRRVQDRLLRFRRPPRL